MVTHLTGTEALNALHEAVRDIRREEDALLSRLAHGAAVLGTLRTHESELFRQLAALRLDAETRGQLSASLLNTEGELAAALARLEGLMAPARDRMSRLDASLSALNTKRTALQADMARCQRELENLARKARPALGADPAFVAARDRAEAAHGVAQAAARKAASVLEAHAAQDQMFRRETLFMYLFERGFGTKAYRGHLLSQVLDGFVARVINFPRARNLFVLVNDLPVRWQAHAEAMAAEARRLAQERDQLESKAVDAAGGRAAREALAAAIAALGALDENILAAEDERDEAIRLGREVQLGGESGFAGALDALTNRLNRPDVMVLLADARATPKGRDVAAVQQIDELRQRARDETEDAREARAQLRLLAARRRDLEDIAHELRSQGLDGANSRFADAQLVTEKLNLFLRAGISASAYWDHWRQAHSYSEESPLAPQPRPGLSRPRGNRPDALTTAA